MQKVGDDGVVMDAYDGWCLTHGCEVDADSEPCPMFDKRWSVEEPSSFYSDEDMVANANAFMTAGADDREPDYRPARYALAVANYIVAALNASCAVVTLEARDVVAAVAWVGSGTFWLWSALRTLRSAR